MLLDFIVFSIYTSVVASDICRTLFVIDGSDYFNSFRSEIVSVSTTANIGYHSGDSNKFLANFWLYGLEGNDQSIPTDFYESGKEFLEQIQVLTSNGGNESIVGAVSQLNGWPTTDALIVIYTASPQNLISLAGRNYTEQARTIALHLKDGVDLSPLSIYKSPSMSDYGDLSDLILYACQRIPKRTSFSVPHETTTQQFATSPEAATSTLRQESTTTKSTTRRSPSTSASIPVCQTLFVLDASNEETSFVGETIAVRIVADLAYSSGTMQFSANVWEYGDDALDPEIPVDFFDSFSDFNDALSGLENFQGEENIIGATNKLNNWSITNAVIVLITASTPNETFATHYLRRSSTLGLSSQEGIDLSPISIIFLPLSSDYPIIVDGIRDVCLQLSPTESTKSIMPSTTTTPIKTCGALFFLDDSTFANGYASLQRNLTLDSAAYLFMDPSLNFSAALYTYADPFAGDPDPAALLHSYDEFVGYLYDLELDEDGDRNVTMAIEQINEDPDFGNVVTILFTNSPQNIIDGSDKNSQQQKTIGIGLEGQELTHLASISLSADGLDPSNLAAVIKNLCETNF